MGEMELNLKATGSDAWRLLDRLHPGEMHHHPRVIFCKAVIDRLTVIKGDLKIMILTDTQEVDLSIQPVDAKGKPAQVEGAPVWVSSDPAIVELVPATDGLSCVAKAKDNLGHAQISVSADADLGEGVRTIAGTIDIDVVAGEAVALSIVAGTAREQV